MPPQIVLPKRRYLVRFNPKRVPHLFTDVLVIGSETECSPRDEGPA